MKTRAPMLFIIFTVTLDAMGIGLIMPVMPDLIREIRGTSISDAALWGGLMSFTYAAMQFLFGPLLGNLSDRYGRRPVLILSLFFMGLDYLLLALAPTLLLFFIARLISGITGATYSTAFAYLADISNKGQRTSNFGMVGAAFGVGFVIGPAIGGLLGELGLRMPFFVAAGFAFANAIFGYFILPETLAPESRRPFELKRANPFAALLNLRHLPTIGGLMLIILLSSVANQVYPAIWSYFTIERFGWSLSTVGISLAVYGISSAVMQVWTLRLLINRYGERHTAKLGMVMSVVSLIAMTFIEHGWIIFAGMPIVALGEVVRPAIQGMIADQTHDSEQGEIQGIFSSVIAIASIISPLVMTFIFREFTKETTAFYQPGAPFAAAAVLAIMALVLFLRQNLTHKVASESA